MEEWQARVIEEGVELEKKMTRLRIFLEEKIFTLDVIDAKLLYIQLGIMEVYSKVLSERIERFL